MEQKGHQNNNAGERKRTRIEHKWRPHGAQLLKRDQVFVQVRYFSQDFSRSGELSGDFVSQFTTFYFASLNSTLPIFSEQIIERQTLPGHIGDRNRVRLKVERYSET